ncbi:hypothetical protein [Aquimarina latercula]|uniref:hypothetical protein n=1 Tax=Aquimarina latercula TaxID=987 RepID=UPI00047FE8E5|nr:hypothetical protein [Aquimarina latercula]
MISTLNTWRGLWSLFIFLIITYWAIQLIIYLLKRFAKRNLGNKRFINTIKKVALFYIPAASLILILDFISINYITHTIILVVISLFGYQYIKNYINGIFFRNNPLFREEVFVKIGDIEGEIEKVLPFGITISEEEGEHYINYSYVEKKGFTIKSDKDSSLRKTMYLKTDLAIEQLLDLLFDNPILNYNDPPSVTRDKESEKLKMQYTLEQGSATEDLIAFLKEQNIQTGLTHNIS